MRAGSAVWLAAGALALAACSSCSSSSSKGGTTTGGDGGSPRDGGMMMTMSDAGGEAGPSATTACADFATAVCGRLMACTPFALQATYGTMATCLQRTALACAPSLNAPGSTTTPSQMELCVQAIGAETCDDWLDNAQPSACNFTGSVAGGSACGTNAQCQTGYCRLAAGTACGTCASRSMNGMMAADGAPECAIDSDCAATLVCNMGVCMSPGAQGATCTMTAPCLRSLACIGGKCATPVAAGGTCSAATDCDGTKGGYCNAQKTCATTSIVAASQPCGIVGSGLAACAGGATCANVSAQGQGTCHPDATDGTACGPGIGCLAPAACVPNNMAYQCTLPDPSSCH
jgi:hypothetical protein